MKCHNCEKETTNDKYCSRSCAAIVNNKLKPKRKLKRTCVKEGCSSTVRSYRHLTCSAHAPQKTPLDLPLSHYHDSVSVKGKHTSWKNSLVRLLGRSAHKELLKLPCAHCGYIKHVELCHIKPLSSFSMDALLSEVNSPSNVIQLCRNCHWEFDHPSTN